MEALRDLADDFNVRDPRKLYRLARQRERAEGPNDRLQADLIDFSQNTRGKTKYGLVVMDVFTREAAVDRELPEAAHRTKRPEDRNAIAVVDRGIQTLKKDLATRVARKGGQWSDHFERAALQRAAPRDGARRARGRGEAAGHGVQGPARQRRQVPAQQGPHRPAREGGAGRGRLPSADERGEELQPSVRRRAAAGGRGLHDRPQHGGPGDPAEAGAAPQGSGNAAGRLTRRRPAAVRQLDDFLAPPRPSTLD